MKRQEIEAQILQREAELLSPEIRTDSARLLTYLDTDFYEISMNGKQYSREEIVELLSHNNETEYFLDESSVSWLTPDILIHNFHCTVKEPDYSETIQTRRSSIWRHSQFRWKLVFHQGTRIIDS